ncbi:hypothetical protein FACS1894193_06370 [Bacilli bacterium]|nr:hypothetical protein FACS1894193_06370 [Bacilli bacterium]GHU45637.1 hypothetical protein FACS1894194_1840 [Bacilli bacterium]
MFKYLFAKNVQTDEDFKKHLRVSLLGWTFIVIALILVTALNIVSSDGETTRFFKIFWFSLPLIITLLGYALDIRKQFKNPEVLRTKKIEVTDERRKHVHQQALAHIGAITLILLVTVMIFSLNAETVTISVTHLSILLLLFVAYVAYRIRK